MREEGDFVLSNKEQPLPESTEIVYYFTKKPKEKVALACDCTLNL